MRAAALPILAPQPTAAAQPIAWYLKAPYLVFFPLGGALAISGMLPWLLFALSWGPWRPGLHAVTEVQGGLMAFAIGFLLTFIPRRTGTPLPTRAEFFTALVLVAPPLVLALLNYDRAAQACWAVLALYLGAFVFLRIPPALRKGAAVSQLLWLPTAFGMAMVGALLTALAGPGRPPWFSALGTSLIWQGMLGALVTGIGGMLLPMLLHREPHKGNRSKRSWCLNALACAAFTGSFALDWAVDLQVGYATRGVVVLTVLVVGARLWRTPRVAGLHRWAAWVAAWMIPAGFLTAAAWPLHRVGFLHLTFLAGYGLLTLSVANHVIIAHGGRDPLLYARPAGLWVMGGAVALATLCRLLVTLDPLRLQLWIGVSASLFVLALGGWAWWVLPRLKPISNAYDKPVGPA